MSKNKKPMIFVFAGPNGSGKSTITQYFDKIGEYRIIRKHKDDISIFPNKLWTEDKIISLMQ